VLCLSARRTNSSASFFLSQILDFQQVVAEDTAGGLEPRQKAICGAFEVFVG